MSKSVMIVKFPLATRTEEQAIKGGTGAAATYRDFAVQGLIRKEYLNFFQKVFCSALLNPQTSIP